MFTGNLYTMFMAALTVHWGWTNTQTFLRLMDTGSKLTLILEAQSVTMVCVCVCVLEMGL